jgi:hypothetical protein
MESVGLPKGLIRYASEDEIVKKEKFKLNSYERLCRCFNYFNWSFNRNAFLRNDVEATILHMPGQLFEHNGSKYQ